MVPPMMIQPFVENAIEHGFIKREKGHVWIHIAPDGEDRICCTVRDDGIGREAAIALRSLDPPVRPDFRISGPAGRNR